MANTTGSAEPSIDSSSSVLGHAHPDRNPAGEELHPVPIVRIKRKHVERLCANQEKIRSFFGVQLERAEGSSCSVSSVVNYKVSHVRKGDTTEEPQAGATAAQEALELAKRVQHYLDTVCVTEAEDSSYDSDCEIDDANHEQVSRTASDTLGQEFAEYVSSCEGSASTAAPVPIQSHDQLALAPIKASLQSQGKTSQFVCASTTGPTYTSRLEFALKLGYTERLVQAALHRLGPNPTQNELLAELIKLGAQQLPVSTGTNKLNCDYICDGTPNECPALGAISGSQQEEGGGGGADDGGSANSMGSSPSDMLRPIVIDGSNVAMSHGNKQSFSCRGIKLCVDWFRNRGHKNIVVFVPKWRKESCSLDNPIKDQEILNELEREEIMVFTPSRFVGGKRMVCYDDRYILKLAAGNDGIVVSNDNYRDLAQENSEFKKVVEDRILMYSFVCDRFMPPDDPLGRSGPTLDNFLRIQPKRGDLPPLCPYGKKCTYGTKCKFNHPERGTGPHKSISERLTEHAQWHLSAARMEQQARTPLQGKSLSVPLNAASGDQCMGMSGGGGESLRKALCRTRSNVVTADSGSHYQQQQQPQKQYSPSYLHCGPQQQQQQLQPPPSSAGMCNRLPAWPPTGDPLQGFPKSHSVENLPCENAPAFSIPSSPSQQQIASTAASQFGQQQQQQQRQMWPPGTGRSSTSVSPSNLHPPPEDMNDGVNLHRKLQRQLTLNPSGCDPRIYQIQRGMCGMPPPRGSQQAVGGGGGGQPHSPHRPLEPSRSSHCGQATPWDMHHHHQHPNVTRIASAPDSSRPWHGGPPGGPASSSEPQINLWPPQHPVHMPSQQQQQQLLQEQRRRLHYHLASIFPEEQVQTVMQVYPDETDPQKICAAILNMFQKI